MAGASLLLLLDDIAAILDDVSILTKVAAKKTAGVLGDDLALNAQQVAGVRAHRELPVVFAVFKGSMLNKAILVPAALAISLWLPWLVTPLMMIGGAYLCYEGVEKLAHKFLHKEDAPPPRNDSQRRAEAVLAKAAAAPNEADVLASEKQKIRGAIRTDFILSAEIIVLSLGVVAGQPLPQQVTVLVVIALAMTFGVYGLVAGIVKLDDVGLWLTKKPGKVACMVGRGLLYATPWLMKTLSVLGTAAMFLVGGGILVHSIPVLHHAVEALGPDGWLGAIVSALCNALVGIAAGALVLGAVTLFGKLRGKAPEPAH
ncbi:DUF808 domain-containing protein [Luteimonas sp. MC1572]|uniref:DUF808 domain-containing protein n=1 Tax=Luteimonas sp. MC1572 TaxID=2799325 RepID=UPI0018F09579|nr:DUF808 domain-containing protein [Luteimonas sp. MC1572]MBJ6982322.1 DUF808 domain-containing protein [Luteimonas sp. MC1572]QQO03591.1 DUF808 domain-containing protein [Luteimonas sp. MC1572]